MMTPKRVAIALTCLIFLLCILHRWLIVKRRIFHLIHCTALIGTIILVMPFGQPTKTEEDIRSWEKYGLVSAAFLYLARVLTLLALPLTLANFVGLIIFNAFPDQPSSKAYNKGVSVPFVCFRVVTRGDYPELVIGNILKNIKTCQEASLEHFVFEVVTDKTISLVASALVREVVIPQEYKTLSRTLYKGRALQYCLEKEVNNLNDDDWIVHLDEETLLTTGCVNGISNFICEGNHQFGQGVITYINGQVVNWFLTLCDSIRVADDMGKVQFQLKVLHMPLLGWKGSYVVSNVAAERDVTYDHGPSSSVAEDAYFGLVAASKGYSFGFIEGDMWEKSPFTIKDFLHQRKRWVQGLLLVAHSPGIPFKFRVLLGCCIYATATAPLTFCNAFLQPSFPIQIPRFVDYSTCFIGGVVLYMNFYGTIRSFMYSRVKTRKIVLMLFLGFVTQPFKIILEIVAILWALVTPKNQFFVIDKHFQPKELEINTI